MIEILKVVWTENNHLNILLWHFACYDHQHKMCVLNWKNEISLFLIENISVSAMTIS